VKLLTAKQSHYRLRQALRVPGCWGSQISRLSAHEGGKFVSPKHRPPLLPKKYSWYSVLLGAEKTPRAIVRLEGLCQWKIAMTLSGIELATFRLVTQCLNQMHHCVLRGKIVGCAYDGCCRSTYPKFFYLWKLCKICMYCFAAQHVDLDSRGMMCCW